MPDPVPAEAFYDLSLPSEVVVSPDGERVAFVATESAPDEDERVSSLFVVPADGSREPYRLTRASEAGSPAWSPDGTKLGFVAARERDPGLRVGREEAESGEEADAEAGDGEDADAEADEEDDGVETGDGADDAESDGGEGDNGGDDEPKPQVWVLDLARGGDARQVTDREEGVREFDWGPDGDRVVVSARDPTDEEREYLRSRRDEGAPVETERLQHKYDGQGWLDTVTTYLFVVDVERREERRLDGAYGAGAAEPAAGLQPAWSPDGDRIAFVSNRTDRPDDSPVADVFTVAPDGGDPRRVTDGDVAARGLSWSPAGDRLAFVFRDPENWYVPSEVSVADLDAGTYGSVSAAIDRTVAWGGEPRWLDGETVATLVGDGARTRVCRCRVGGDPERAFERQGDYETLLGFDAAGGTVAFVASRPGEGNDVFAMPVAGLSAGPDDDYPWTRLSALNDDLVAAHPAPGCRRVTFDSGDATIEGLAYHPEDFDPDAPDPRPLVLAIHGGPMAYDQPRFAFDDLYWTSRGYVVFRVNYRGSTSYGRSFCEVLRGNWNSVEVDDLLAGVDAVVDRGWADPDRLFATGFSQGGINTAYLLTRTTRFAAAAAEHGIYDARSAFGTDDSHNWWEADYGLPWENPAGYDEASSLTDVGEIETPTLLTAGGEDWRCPPTQAEQLHVSLRKRGVESKLVVYPDEHHDVGDPDRAVHRLETLTEWFEAHDPAVETGG